MAGIPVQPTSLNTHISTDFGHLLEPGLRKIFFDYLAEVPEQYSKLFKMETSTKAEETDWGMGAFGDWKERADELDVVDYQKISSGVERKYTHVAYTQGFQIGRELYDDDQYRKINKFPMAMARSGRAFVEKKAISVLTDAFTKVMYDGKALIAADHPLVDSASTGTNLLTGPLTEAKIKEALVMLREQKDEAGNPVPLKGTTLVVPPQLEHTARVIMQSTLLPGSENNDANVVKGSLEIMVMDYLGAAAGGSDTNWFVIDKNSHELTFFWRIKPEFKADDVFDNFVAKYRGYMRFSYGASDYRGIVGSTGL